MSHTQPSPDGAAGAAERAEPSTAPAGAGWVLASLILVAAVANPKSTSSWPAMKPKVPAPRRGSRARRSAPAPQPG